MERLLAWYRVTSSVGAVVALLVANAVPLIGVLYFGWNVWTVLIVYWLENGIVGGYNVLKILKAEGKPDGASASARVTINGRPVDDGAKGALVGFFILHYGLFWVVHGIFVLMLPVFGMMGDVTGDGSTDMTVGFSPVTILVALIALTISHGVSYVFNFVHGGEYRRVSPQGVMFAPYGRLVVLHVTIILGAMAIALTGAPEAAVVVLVVLKTLLDLGFHLASHRAIAPSQGAVIEA